MNGVRVTVLEVPANDAELAADRMMQAGAFAVEERRVAPDRVELRAAIGERAEDRLGELPAQWVLRVEVADAEPLETWREFAVPIEVAADLVLRPAWLPVLNRGGVTELAIEPGAAFGLGDHPTTLLSAAAVWRAARRGARMLDVGCGTGALAIVALAAGADQVVAIDIAEPAVSATLANAVRNAVGDRITASTTPLAAIDAEFDLVAANILAPTLVALAADLRRVTAPHGTLIISGVLTDRYTHVLDALAPMTVVATHTRDGWAAVELRHQT
jgi:ribosomal protein L11 methyltransferase